MKHLCLLSILLVAAGLCLPGGSEAGQRVALLESFTNASCGPCASQNPITHQFITDYTALRVINIQYHMSWPGVTDPFYQTDIADNNLRRAYYGINAVPALETDGSTTSTGSYTALQGMANYRLGTPAPLDIDVSAGVVSDTVHVAVQIHAVDDVPASGLILRVAVVEPYVHYASPPGTNGETDFYCAMRDCIPTATGTSISITNGQTLNYNFASYVNPSWQNVYVVAWVQHDPTKEVLQAATSLQNTTNFACFYGWYHPSGVVARGALLSFPSMLSNLGREADIYDVHIEQSVPASWGASVCANGVCYPPWQTDFTMNLQPDTQDTILVDIQPLTEIGTGTVTITATSQGDPTDIWSRTFKVISDGFPLLVVDDDGGASYEANTKLAIDATGVSYATWDRDSDGKIATPELGFFQSVIWGTGLAYPSFDADDRAAVAAYLDGGGNMFVNGQDIGWDLCDANGSDYSADAVTWYQTYLGATYVSDDTNDLTITGIAGDVIGDGLSFAISAATQLYPSEINPYGGGVASLIYSAGREAVVHKQGTNYKTVYMAFGFEGLTTVTPRNTVMQRILQWFGTTTVGVGEPAVVPAYLATAPIAGPNPFNPSTKIRFTIGGTQETDAQVAVYDVQGRRVRELWDGAVKPGPQEFAWDGRSQSGRAMPSGVYIARVSVAGKNESFKLIMAK